MFNVGDRIYRYSFEAVQGKLEVTKYTFEVTAIKQPTFEYGPFDKVKFNFKCLEDSKVIYKSGKAIGGFIGADDVILDKAKGAGKAIYVTLNEDNEDKAKNLAIELIKSRIANLKSKLASEEFQLAVFEAKSFGKLTVV